MLLSSISFKGNCEEAINYYKRTLGAEVKEICYLDEAPVDLDYENPTGSRFVSYSEIAVFGTSFVMVDGAACEMKNHNFWFSLILDTEEEVRTVFNKLADGGQITEPLAPQFWARLSGDVIDRFGIEWNVLMRN